MPDPHVCYFPTLKTPTGVFADSGDGRILHYMGQGDEFGGYEHDPGNWTVKREGTAQVYTYAEGIVWLEFGLN